MTTKNKYYLLLSILTFLAVLVAMLKTFEKIVVFDVSIAPIWIVIWVFAFLLPIGNIAEIINNRDEWNTYYWIGLFFNILSIVFITRHFKIDLF